MIAVALNSLSLKRKPPSTEGIEGGLQKKGVWR